MTTEGRSRPMKPRPQLVVRASFVSDETSYALFGIVARKFSEIVVPKCQRVTHIGRTVLVEVGEAERVIRQLEVNGTRADESASADGEAEHPQTAAEVLAALGQELRREPE